MKEHSAVRDLLSLAVAGVLDPAEQRQVEEHLRGCDACRTELNEWRRLARVLRELPTPQAPPKLVLQTRRLLEAYTAAKGKYQGSRLVLVFLIGFSWIVSVLTWQLVGRLDIPLTQWLNVSSTIIWIAYIGTTWLATVLAAGMLGKHAQQEGKTP
jgi:anti-sigma factor RsiW